MNLRQLKRMIREEYSNYTAEQEEIGVDVQPDDVDMGDADMGDDNAEETLRDIYDMLKDYFEGGDAAAADVPGDMDGDGDVDADDAGGADDDDDSDDDDDDDKEALQERFQKLANIIKG